MKLIQTVDVEGTVLCRSIIQIIKGATKDAVLRKGHVVIREDIPALLSVGKDQLYVWGKEDGMLHENDAAEIFCDMCKGQSMGCSQIKKGKVELTTMYDGLLKVDNRGLKTVNGFGQMMIVARHSNSAVKGGNKLAGTRVIPLIIEEEKMEAVKRAAAEATGGCPTLELEPFLHEEAGIVTTGNRAFYGYIQDAFTPVIRGKLSEFDTRITDHMTWNDDDTKVTASILDMIQKDVDMVVCIDGMSVDPDDKAPLATRNTGADIVSYKALVLPGTMFLLAHYQVRDGENPHTIAITGPPGCVIYAKHTIFDPVLPRIMADDQVAVDDLAVLDQGGLCLNCSECTLPNYGLGKGM